MAESQASYKYISRCEEDTERLAAELARRLEPGAVIALDGDLGAGKTRFSQAVAKAIGVTGVVNSPTFTIIKEYEGERFPLYHMDLYRITLEEAEELGLDEYFYGEGVTLIEWSSRITEILPADRLFMYIEHLGGQERSFTVIPYGEPYTTWCENLKGSGIIV